jgi:hypothetical protein
MVAVQHLGVQDELSALRRVRPRNRVVRRARVLPQPKHGPQAWHRVDRPHTPVFAQLPKHGADNTARRFYAVGGTNM